MVISQNGVRNLCREKVRYMRIDGSVATSSRQAMVNDFQNNSDLRCAVLSIKAAGDRGSRSQVRTAGALAVNTPVRDLRPWCGPRTPFCGWARACAAAPDLSQNFCSVPVHLDMLRCASTWHWSLQAASEPGRLSTATLVLKGLQDDCLLRLCRAHPWWCSRSTPGRLATW